MVTYEHITIGHLPALLPAVAWNCICFCPQASLFSLICSLSKICRKYLRHRNHWFLLKCLFSCLFSGGSADISLSQQNKVYLSLFQTNCPFSACFVILVSDSPTNLHVVQSVDWPHSATKTMVVTEYSKSHTDHWHSHMINRIKVCTSTIQFIHMGVQPYKRHSVCIKANNDINTKSASHNNCAFSFLSLGNSVRWCNHCTSSWSCCYLS